MNGFSASTLGLYYSNWLKSIGCGSKNQSAVGLIMHYQPAVSLLRPAERVFWRGRFSIWPRILIIICYNEKRHRQIMDWSLHKYFIIIIVFIIINIVIIIINYQRTFMRLILKLKEDLPDFLNGFIAYNSAY